MASKSFHALVVAAALLVGWPSVSLSAQDPKGTAAGSAYPSGFENAFEWRYSCANGRNCSFECPGSGGASHVTKLALHLGTIRLGTQDVGGVFYEFSTMEIPRANGFNITTGISTLACQVQGMTLDYSGLPKKNEPPAVKKVEPAAISGLDR